MVVTTTKISKIKDRVCRSNNNNTIRSITRSKQDFTSCRPRKIKVLIKRNKSPAFHRLTIEKCTFDHRTNKGVRYSGRPVRSVYGNVRLARQDDI